MVRRALLSALACALMATAQPLTSSHTKVSLRVDSVAVRSADLTLFNYPGAYQTYVTAINNKNVVLGFYADVSGGHGLARFPGGKIASFSAPGTPDIYPDSINSGGQIAGNYGFDPQGLFRETAPAGFIPLDLPGSTPSSSGNPIVINDSGFIAGPYVDAAGNTHGFIAAPSGKLSTIDAPDSTYTYATCINAGGSVTGIYDDSSYNSHAFVRSPDGQWVSFDVPGGNFGFFPPPLSINNSGQVVGSYFDTMTQGFLWQSGSSLVTFNVAGAAGTWPAGINSSGTIAGSYQDSSYNYHGFLRDPSGVIYTFSVPDAMWTYVVAINDSGAVAGYILDSSYTSHGFLLVP
jgi:hypothetical protein